MDSDGHSISEEPAIASHLSTGDAESYYPWFDWLRFLLACVVLISHQGLLDVWPDAANFAVQVFFALSGWLIGGLLVRLPEHELLHFYFNRALRIWCPYFLAFGLLIAISLLRDRVTRKYAEIVFYKATFVYNLFGISQLALHRLEMPLAGTGNHFWSVNAEEQFYLVAPLILVLIPRRYGRAVLTWIAIAGVSWVSRTYASIVFGVLAAVAANAYGPYYSGYLGRAVAAFVAIVSAVGLLVGADYDSLAPVCAIAIVLLFAIPGRRHRWGALAGRISYPLYLNAWIAVFGVNFLGERLGLRNALVYHALTLASGIFLAGLLYWHVDRRILARRRRLYTLRRARIVTAFAYGTVAIGVGGAFFLFQSPR